MAGCAVTGSSAVHASQLSPQAAETVAHLRHLCLCPVLTSYAVSSPCIAMPGHANMAPENCPDWMAQLLWPSISCIMLCAPISRLCARRLPFAVNLPQPFIRAISVCAPVHSLYHMADIEKVDALRASIAAQAEQVKTLKAAGAPKVCACCSR